MKSAISSAVAVLSFASVANANPSNLLIRCGLEDDSRHSDTLELYYTIDANGRGGKHLVISGEGTYQGQQVGANLRILGIERYTSNNPSKSILDFWTDGAAAEASSFTLTKDESSYGLPFYGASMQLNRHGDYTELLLEGNRYQEGQGTQTSILKFSYCRDLNDAEVMQQFEK